MSNNIYPVSSPPSTATTPFVTTPYSASTANLNLISTPSDMSWVDPFQSRDKQLQDIESRLGDIEKRLLIVVPNMKLLDKYESLKNAYDHYKCIEALLYEKDK